MIAEVITISPEIQSGTPVFAGTRVPVKNFFDYIKAGDTTEEFLNDFPSVAKEQVAQLLEFTVSTKSRQLSYSGDGVSYL